MKKIGLIIAGVSGLLVILGIAALIYVISQLQPVSASPQPTQQFVIPKGQAVAVIANRLKEAGLIRHDWAFRLELRRLGMANKLQAGAFDLSPSMTLAEIIATLGSGSEDVWVTIPEGWRREEIAENLDTLDLPVFDKERFLELTEDQEGRLFPDTYLVPQQVTAQQLADLFKRTFDQKVVQGLATQIENAELSLDQALVLASLVERESRGADEMRQVAGVLANRLEIGMALQVDATLQYAKGYNTREKSWWAVPLAADKQIKSPFNTYQNAGLPPAPIANPGLDAIKAALNPAENDYLFYIHDNSGQIHLARTLDEHNANVQRYLR